MSESKGRSEAAKRAKLKYKKTGIKQLAIELYKTTDADIIEWLEHQQKATYIKRLIREDMARQQGRV